MERNQLSAAVLEVLCSAISTETVRKYEFTNVEAPLADLSLDPLAIMNVLEMVNDRTGIELPASLFRDCATVSDVAKKSGTTANGS
jgi:acyl carrier protein